MTISTKFVLTSILMLGMTSPAFAQVAGSASPISEPTDLALFVLGVAGLIIGRRSSRSRHKGDQ